MVLSDLEGGWKEYLCASLFAFRLTKNQSHLRLSLILATFPSTWPQNAAQTFGPNVFGGLRLIRSRRRVTVAKMFSIVFTLNKRQTISFLKRQIK